MVLTKNAPTKQSEVITENSSPAKVNGKTKVKANITRIVVHFDVGFNNNLFIRGSGANLNWNKGIMLLNTRPDEWVWETEQIFNSCEFKVLINDSHYEEGDNHTITCNNCIEYTPRFCKCS